MDNHLAKVYRGRTVESIHHGHVAVVRHEAGLVAKSGNPEFVTFFRSAAKPFQLVPVLDSGAPREFDFTDRELAVMAASHGGEPMHLEVVEAAMLKAGLDVSRLQCGSHAPMYQPVAERLLASGRQPSPLHNNCSGKHTGMLAACKVRNWDMDTYLQPNHPHQESIRQELSRWAGCPAAEPFTGVDGCSVPTFALALTCMARAYAALAEGVSTLGRVFQVMNTHPEMVAGTRRFDTEIMRLFPGRVVSKMGAEGMQCLALRHERGSFGIAVKIEDGSDRAAPAVMLETLRKLSLVEDADLEALVGYHKPRLLNHAGRETGRIDVDFELDVL